MDDVQNYQDERRIAIDQVGVSDLRYPIVVLDRDQGKQHTIASLKMSVSLPHHFKGTHMSRFLEAINDHRGQITIITLLPIYLNLPIRLETESAHIEGRSIRTKSGNPELIWIEELTDMAKQSNGNVNNCSYSYLS